MGRNLNFEEIISKLPKPYYRDNQSDIVIYNAECRDILPLIPDKSIDLVLTDPPYGVSQKCNFSANEIKKYGNTYFGDWDNNFPYEILKFLPISATYYIFCPYYVLGKLSDWADERKLLKRVLWWHKTNPTRRNGDTYWAIAGEYCFYAKQSGATFNAKYKVGFFEYPNVIGKHPTQKPLKLISEFILASSNANDIVLDPFLGSGTTLVACKKLNRKGIGIEISEIYCKMAIERLRQGVLF